MIETPELDKIKNVHEKSQMIGFFLDWLQGHGFVICRWREEYRNGEPQFIDADTGEEASLLDHNSIENPDYEYATEGYYPERLSIEQYLAMYFNIDLDKAEEERRAILEELRNRNK
jgi:hypothetical protein